MLLLTNTLRHDSWRPPPSSSFLMAPGVSDALQTDIARIAAMFDRHGPPALRRCCAVTSELIAALLRRAGWKARSVSCHLTLRAPEGIAHLGAGFARPGQIDGHYVVITDDVLIDGALAGLAAIPELASCPPGIVVPREPGPWQRAEGFLAPAIHACWDATTASPDAERLRNAEKMKAVLLLKRWGRPAARHEPVARHEIEREQT